MEKIQQRGHDRIGVSILVVYDHPEEMDQEQKQGGTSVNNHWKCAGGCKECRPCQQGCCIGGDHIGTRSMMTSVFVCLPLFSPNWGGTGKDEGMKFQEAQE